MAETDTLTESDAAFKTRSWSGSGNGKTHHPLKVGDCGFESRPDYSIDMSRGGVQIYFLTDLKKVNAPTLLELVRGMNLTPLIMMIDGWMLRDGLDTSSLTLDGFEAYDLFPEGLAGFLVIKPPSNSGRVEVWPCAVSKRERLMNAWGQSRVFFSSSQPELSGNIADYQRRTWRAYLGMGKLRLLEGR